MRTRVLLLALLGLVALPGAAAATEAERDTACLFPDVMQLCDAAVDSRLGEVFAGHADVVLFVLADVVLAILIVLVVMLLKKFRPLPVIKIAAAEKVKEIEPGGSARFRLELENLRGKQPIEVLIDRPDSAGNWATDLRVAQVNASGFKVLGAASGNGSIRLTSKGRGGHRAQLELVLRAPADAGTDESLEYVMSAVPVVGGRVRTRKSRKVRVTALVSRTLPQVKITDVKHEPARIAPGVLVTTRARVANVGEVDASNVNVVFLLNGTELESKFLASLATKADQQIEFRWTPKPGENKIRLALR